MAKTFKTFTDGSTLPAADLNTYLQKQAVIQAQTTDRPSSPQTGMTIIETDYSTAPSGGLTPGLKQYNGVAWTPPWNLPWGLISTTKVTAAPSSFTTGTNVMASASVTVTKNRRYKISAGHYRLDSTVANEVCGVGLDDGTTAFAQNYVFSSPTSAGSGGFMFGTYDAAAAGSITFRYYAGRTASSTGTWTMQAAATAPIYLLVEDAGPVPSVSP